MTDLCFLRPTRVQNPNDKSTHSAVLAQLMAESPYTYNGLFFPPKLPHAMGGSGPPSNAWFPGPTRVLNTNGISIGSAIFAGLTSVTNRLTDHATQSVYCIYVCSTGDVVQKLLFKSSKGWTLIRQLYVMSHL